MVYDSRLSYCCADYRFNAEYAKVMLQGVLLGGSKLDIRWASSRSAVCVKGLGKHVTNEMLYDAFVQFGAVLSAVVVMDAMSRVSKGFGLVEFNNKRTAEAAIAQRALILPGQI